MYHRRGCGADSGPAVCQPTGDRSHPSIGCLYFPPGQRATQPECHCPLTSTKLCCLVMGTLVARSRYAALPTPTAVVEPERMHLCSSDWRYDTCRDCYVGTLWCKRETTDSNSQQQKVNFQCADFRVLVGDTQPGWANTTYIYIGLCVWQKSAVDDWSHISEPAATPRYFLSYYR